MEVLAIRASRRTAAWRIAGWNRLSYRVPHPAIQFAAIIGSTNDTGKFLKSVRRLAVRSVSASRRMTDYYDVSVLRRRG